MISYGEPVVERQHVVLVRLLEPGVDQLLQPLGFLLGEIVPSARSLSVWNSLPHVLVEVPIPDDGPWTVTAFQPFSQMPRVPSIA